MSVAVLALALAAAGTPDHIGRIYSYLRSNRDGTEAERIYVYRAARDRIEVAKMRGSLHECGLRQRGAGPRGRLGDASDRRAAAPRCPA